MPRSTINHLQQHLSPQNLRVLVAIEKHRSLAAAASAVNLVPSAVSRRLQELEAAAGVELLKRTPRAVEFTVAGRRLLERAYRILAEIDGFAAELDAFDEGVASEVILVASTFALHAGLPDDLAGFARRFPRIRLTLKTMSSRDAIDGLRRRQADVGIFAAALVPSELRARVYRQDHMTLLMPLDHPLASKASVRFQEMAAYELLRLPEGSEAQHLLEIQAKRHDVQLRQPLQASSLDAMVLMTRAGLGLAFGPASGWDSLGPLQGLRKVLIDEAWSTTQLLVATPVCTPSTSAAWQLFSELSTAANTV